MSVVLIRDISTNRMKGVWYLQSPRDKRQNGTLYYLSKRFIDLLICVPLLIVLLPMMLLIAFIIKLDSPGPALFRQKRCGSTISYRPRYRHTVQIREFTLLKFRTMYSDASSDLHKKFITAYISNNEAAMSALQKDPTDKHNKYKMTADPRITRVGHILRKTSLDELPQLWNILIGDMSLVGPRPAIRYETEMYSWWQFQRFETIPGLTGLWQVKGRSSTTFEDMVRLDIAYIENQSLWLDIKIIFATPFAVIAGRGAN